MFIGDGQAAAPFRTRKRRTLHDRRGGPTASAQRRARRRASTRLGLVYFALVAATLLPLAIWPIPPSFDLVNHWARLTLYHMAPGDPLAALYQVRLTPIPDLAVDLAGLALSPILTPYGVIALAWGASIACPPGARGGSARRSTARRSPPCCSRRRSPTTS